MSLKQEIETWLAALAAYDNNEFDNAIKCFEQIADTSKILFNCGVIHATLGEHATAVECYQRAVQLDQYLAISYFQQGVSNFLLGDFEEALANFNDALLYLRGNNHIDYEQLGLKFKLYSCEVLFNRGLCYIYLQQKDAGMHDLLFATREKVLPDHDVIDDAIREQAEGYTVFSIPVGLVYRPNAAKVKNLKAKNYLGRARLVAAQAHHPSSDARRHAVLAAAAAVNDRPGEKLSYAALNLVRPDLRSRGARQQSAPPGHRHLFFPPPTTTTTTTTTTPSSPELDRPDSAHGGTTTRKSSESTPSERSHLQAARPGAKPLRLELGAAAFAQNTNAEPRPRLRPTRSESERPATWREHDSARPTRSAAARQRREPRPTPRGAADVRIADDAVAEPRQPHPPPSHPRPRSRRSQPLAIGEEADQDAAAAAADDDDDADDGLTSPPDPLAFDPIPAPPPPLRRAPDPRTLRIKVHAHDIRYLLTSPSVAYPDLAAHIRSKFALSGPFKLKTRDEDGDLVTMADQDDLDMAIAAAAAADRGKMDLWVQDM